MDVCLFLFSHLRADGGREEKRKKERKWLRCKERRERGKRVLGNAFPRPCIHCTIPQLFALLPKEGGGGGRQKVVLKTTIFLSRGRRWGEEPMFGMLSLRGKQNEIRQNGVYQKNGSACHVCETKHSTAPRTTIFLPTWQQRKKV